MFYKIILNSVSSQTNMLNIKKSKETQPKSLLILRNVFIILISELFSEFEKSFSYPFVGALWYSGWHVKLQI